MVYGSFFARWDSFWSNFVAASAGHIEILGGSQKGHIEVPRMNSSEEGDTASFQEERQR